MAKALQPKTSIDIVQDKVCSDFSLLVDAFVWLIQEDKKQNPELHKLAKKV